jgi:hypothetical protein
MKHAIVVAAVGVGLMLGAAVAVGAAPDAEGAMKAELRKFSTRGTLKDGLAELGKLASVRIEADWNALAAVGVGANDKVDISLDKPTASQALDVMLRKASPSEPLAWRLDDGAVWVTTQRRLIGGSARPAASRPADAASSTAAAAAGASTRPSVGGNYSFEGVALSTVLDYFATLMKSNFYINWKSLEAAGISKDTPVTLKLTGATIEQALDRTLEGINTGRDRMQQAWWVIDEGVLTIASGQTLNSTLSTRTFEIRDLLGIVPDFDRPQTGLNTSATGGSTNSSAVGSTFLSGVTQSGTSTPAKSRAEQRQSVQDNIIGAVKDSIGDDMWKPLGKGDVRILNGRLLITQTPLGFRMLEKAASAMGGVEGVRNSGAIMVGM